MTGNQNQNQFYIRASENGEDRKHKGKNCINGLHQCSGVPIGVARFFEYSLNAPGLSIPIVEGVAKVRFKSQGCREAKKFAEHWSTQSKWVQCEDCAEKEKNK